MTFGGNRGQLDDAQKAARARWDALGETWADAARREHEAEAVEPMDELVTALLRAVDQMSAAFVTVRRACEFDPS